MYKQLYGSDFSKKDIAVLYPLYEAELKKLNMVVSENILRFTSEIGGGVESSFCLKLTVAEWVFDREKFRLTSN